MTSENEQGSEAKDVMERLDPSTESASAQSESSTETGVRANVPRVGEPNSPPKEFSPIVLEKLDENLFRASKRYLWKPRGQRGIYGGQVLGQGLSACLQSVDAGKELHSMHAYFLRAGKDTSDIIYLVTPMRDGASYSTRMVTAQQGGLPILVLIASFQVPRIGSLVNQDFMPIVPGPDHLPTEREWFLSLMDDPRCSDDYKLMIKSRVLAKTVIDLRRVVTQDWFAHVPMPKDTSYKKPAYPEYSNGFTQIAWMRASRKLPDDPNVHRAVLAYASDMGLLITAKGNTSPHDLAMVASLDHTMYFHAEFRADEWLLYEMHSPRSGSERGLSIGKIYRQDGTLAVTVCQEGVIRLRSDAKL